MCPVCKGSVIQIAPGVDFYLCRNAIREMAPVEGYANMFVMELPIIPALGYNPHALLNDSGIFNAAELAAQSPAEKVA